MSEETKTKEEMSPSEYFQQIKDAQNKLTMTKLKDSFQTFIMLAEKYKKLGQVESMKKLNFLAKVMVQEEKLLSIGIDTFVYRDTIEDYIENVASKTVKIIELSRYTREIPDELVSVIEQVKPIFDELYVVFTDYTGKEERKVEKELRDKDPILFGVFKNNRHISDRFYYVGDWVDEYCDLTLDKMIDEYQNKKGYSPAIKENIPRTSDELISILDRLTPKEDKNSEGVVSPSFTTNTKPKKESFFEKIRSFLR